MPQILRGPQLLQHAFAGEYQSRPLLQPCNLFRAETNGLWVEELERCWQVGGAGLRAARAVSKEYQDACRDIQEILLAPSSAGKIAKLLLSWANGHNNRDPVMGVRY
ncbi:MAG TPA: hypothetical protein VEV41_26470 [Terriglobales bacterium]|nr:hypothetical protein [Terriglobales bacterium]